jgi:hypothetical protein
MATFPVDAHQNAYFLEGIKKLTDGLIAVSPK